MGGCANWHSIQMAPYPNEPFITATEEDCYDACAATPDCKYGNWQKIENDKCPDDEPLGFPYASQQGKGACYMFNGECTGSKSTGSTGIGARRCPAPLPPLSKSDSFQGAACGTDDACSTAASRADGVSGYFRARVEIVVTIISQ